MYNSRGDNMDGIILIDKAKGFTSHDVVAKLRGILRTRKIGHSGTLDPEATGLLVVGVNKGTKIMKFINQDEKIYQATACIGRTTDTLDDDGTIIEEMNIGHIPENIAEVVSSFKGEYTFEIPMYSAVKVKGKKLYEYAREGKKPDIDLSKTVTVYDIKMLSEPYIKDGLLFVQYQVHASKGLYVRSLSKDIGAALGFPAYNYELRRIQAGKFHISDAHKLEDLEKNSPKVISLADALPFVKLEVTDSIYADLKHGRKITVSSNEAFLSVVDQENHLLAVYQKESEQIYKAVNVFLEGETR